VNLDEQPEDATFRREVREWLVANAEVRAPGALRLFESDHDETSMERARQWQAKKFAAGWAGITWPREHGGRGGTVMQQVIWNQEVEAFDAPEDVFMVGIAMAGPTLMTHGSDAQQAALLPPLLRGEEIWCQLFSEPDAGSDLASLRTTARPADGGFVVRGQKVWTTMGHHARRGLLLARTNPDRPKHGGISYFALDMSTPGVSVRPLRQMTGSATFCEVFLDEVFVPADTLIGELDGGWQVARTTLAHERISVIGGGFSVGIDVRQLAELANGTSSSPPVRQELAELYCWSEIQRYLGLRVISALARGEAPGAEGSVIKLGAARMVARAGDLALKLEAPYGTLDRADAPDRGAWQQLFLGAPAVRIAGGSDEIQRNILAERVLGLPREPEAAPQPNSTGNDDRPRSRFVEERTGGGPPNRMRG
jgi:alkylation response protein AidB-like acyl-CoA dehydrogenase